MEVWSAPRTCGDCVYLSTWYLSPAPPQAFMASRGLQRPVEVETSSLAQVSEVMALLHAAEGGADGSSGSGSIITRIMLDNMTKKSAEAAGGWMCVWVERCCVNVKRL